MEVILAAVLLALVFAALAYPLYAGRVRVQFAGGNTLDELTAQRDGIYAMLRDVDQDYQLGKLDDVDYRERREKYLAQATGVLQQLDAQRKSGPVSVESDEIEREVAALRRPRHDTQTAAAAFCRNCGRPVKPGDRFCAKCGHGL
ncbi:MAG: zinc ribbon domain-containing protein [Anaerolineae bacterium]